MKKIYITGILFFCIITLSLAGCTSDKETFKSIRDLLSRIWPQQMHNFDFELIKTDADDDVFELETVNGKLIIRGNNLLSISSGLNWYIKYYCHNQISWCGNNTDWPATLPKVMPKIRKSTELNKRFYFNYCTYSYSMAWWDWARWEQEIDWMALHGVNMPLMIVGEEAVWQNTLKRLNYSNKEIKTFLSGPAYFAWFYMNNLEGWGGPLPDSWITSQIKLRKKIQQRMKEYGMTPVFQGFYGMVPSNLNEKFPDADIHNPGLWCGFKRPAFLLPTDSLFNTMASIYYEEQQKLFGTSCYYAGDPFHEGGNTQGVDLKASGDAIYRAMKQINPKAKWVMQSWQGNPKRKMIDHLDQGEVVILDLHAEDLSVIDHPDHRMSVNKRFGKHDYIFSMVHNYGGNTGMYGKMDELANRVYKMRNKSDQPGMVGIGTTPEGIDNNPVVYELLFELPWHKDEIEVDKWLDTYIKSRYGLLNEELKTAWSLLHHTVYACNRRQQGTTESILCARPAREITHVSGWGNAVLNYDPSLLHKAASLLLSQADRLKNVDTYQYDVVDVMRQVLADRANELHKEVIAAYNIKDLNLFDQKSEEFLQLVLDQDTLVGSRKEFLLGAWISHARAKGNTDAEKGLYEWNARTQITTWGPREAADGGQLHEYAHKEWSGLLKDFYYPRWKMYFDFLRKDLKEIPLEEIDFYAWEEQWTQQQNPYPASPKGDPITLAKKMWQKYNAISPIVKN
ncbi:MULTISPECIES: alpha-N-acetylglucosaminidase [unclassified Carboxylicivirga]|uniref:alpha-N-acetylglucosaminidase n=1 Tax=Carboxylicivirga TaxID=1628153 RepID=UPI003D345458